MNYTSLFLDLDNTLLDFNKAEAVAIRTVLAENGLPSDSETVRKYSAINKAFWEQFERGEIPKSTIFTGRFEVLLNTMGKSGNPDLLSKQYASHLAEGYYTIDDTFHVLDFLKSKNYHLYATTNGIAATQYRRIKKSGLEPYFERVFISEDAGHQKPEKEYFDYVVQNIPEKNRGAMLIIGDSQSSDILGGINAAIDTCWYNPNREIPKFYSKYEITSLMQLKTIL